MSIRVNFACAPLSSGHHRREDPSAVEPESDFDATRKIIPQGRGTRWLCTAQFSYSGPGVRQHRGLERVSFWNVVSAAATTVCVAITRRSANDWRKILLHSIGHCRQLTAPARRSPQLSPRCPWRVIAGTTISCRHALSIITFCARLRAPIVVACDAEIIAHHPRSYERADLIFDPRRYLALIEGMINALPRRL